MDIFKKVEVIHVKNEEGFWTVKSIIAFTELAEFKVNVKKRMPIVPIFGPWFDWLLG